MTTYLLFVIQVLLPKYPIISNDKKQIFQHGIAEKFMNSGSLEHGKVQVKHLNCVIMHIYFSSLRFLLKFVQCATDQRLEMTIYLVFVTCVFRPKYPFHPYYLFFATQVLAADLQVTCKIEGRNDHLSTFCHLSFGAKIPYNFK